MYSHFDQETVNELSGRQWYERSRRLASRRTSFESLASGNPDQFDGFHSSKCNHGAVCDSNASSTTSLTQFSCNQSSTWQSREKRWKGERTLWSLNSTQRSRNLYRTHRLETTLIASQRSVRKDTPRSEPHGSAIRLSELSKICCSCGEKQGKFRCFECCL